MGFNLQVQRILNNPLASQGLPPVDPIVQQFVLQYLPPQDEFPLLKLRELQFELRPILPLQMQIFYQSSQIVAARPLVELWSHVFHFQLPSFDLLARAIKVLALAIFRWHFYDQVLLLREEALIHSSGGKVEEIQCTGREITDQPGWPRLYFTQADLDAFNKKNPHLLKSAHYFTVDYQDVKKLGNNEIVPHKTRTFVRMVDPLTEVEIPDFGDYLKINAQSISEYFRTFEKVDIKPCKSIYGLLNLKEIKKIDRPM
jgi:hypothetical protein